MTDADAGETFEPGVELRPRPDRFDPQHPLYEAVVDAHRRAIVAGADHYVDPLSGFAVFTARALLDRGWCCAVGCRHCPYADSGGARLADS